MEGRFGAGRKGNNGREREKVCQRREGMDLAAVTFARSFLQGCREGASMAGTGCCWVQRHGKTCMLLAPKWSNSWFWEMRAG